MLCISYNKILIEIEFLRMEIYSLNLFLLLLKKVGKSKIYKVIVVCWTVLLYRAVHINHIMFFLDLLAVDTLQS